MITQDEALAHLIGVIYGAALDPAQWPDALAASAVHVGGEAAGVVTKDIASPDCVVHYQFGFDPAYVKTYSEQYWTSDPFSVSRYFPVDQPTTVEDYLSHAEFREGRFYQEWSAPQGWIDASSLVIERTPTRCSFFIVARQEAHGCVDDEMTEQMRLVGPHVRRAMAIGRLVDRGQAERETLSDVLDGLSAGVFLLDAAGRIVHANAAARTVLAAQDFLFSARGRLVAREAATDHALRAALLAAGRDRTINAGAVTLPLVARDGARHVAHLLPLAAGAAAGGGRAVAAVFVHKAAIDPSLMPETVARHFKLTPTELRVLLGIVEVGGAREVADALGVADNTVKTHLSRLYQKTGARRQADLVKLVAGFSTPLVSHPETVAGLH
jgi:DNA-binding CsgD family transcriptional regulator/PAS domain-containing protein